MKVLQILPKLDEGGVERGTIEIASYLEKKGHKAFVIAKKGRMVDNLLKTGATYIDWAIGKKSLFVFKYFFPLRAFLIKEKIDILHVRSKVPAWLSYLVLKTIPLNKRPKFITTFHGFYTINKFSSIMAKGEKVISVSNGVTSHIKKHYKVESEKIELIHRGFDEEKFNPLKVDKNLVDAFKKKWGIENITHPIIIFPARLSRVKKHLFIINSVNLIKDLDFTLLFVGSLNKKRLYYKKMEKLIKKFNLEKKIIFTDNCNRMPECLSIAGIVISSIRKEAFGRVSVEASAMEKPLLGAAIGGNLETIVDEKTGLLFKPDDIYDMAEKLKKLILDENLRKTLGQNGRAWALQNFTTEKMCTKTIDLYKKLTQ